MAKVIASPQIFILENLIRQGQIRQAQQILIEITKADVPRGVVRKLASLARRAGLPDLGMRILYPYLEKGGSREEKTDEDLAEYAANLVRAGAPKEALALLERLDAQKNREVSLFKAFALIGEWRYAEAANLLKQYLASEEKGSYARLVAETNLASCHLHDADFASAENLLTELREQTRAQNFILLHGLSWKMWAQLFIEKEDFGAAQKALTDAERALLRAGNLDQVFVEKWHVFLRLKKDGPTSENLSALKKARTKALNARHWETVRDCDRAQLFAKPTEALYQRLYFGTPFQSFRESLESRMSSQFSLPETYDWQPGSKPTKTVSLLEEDGARLPAKLKTGETAHRLLLTLSSDFYRPFRTASLFGQIYPGEFFNPDASGVRVRMAIQRLRSVLKTGRLPILIETSHGEYRISPESKVAVTVRGPQAGKDRWEILCEKLKIAVGDAEFTAKEAASKFDSSSRTLQRLLERAMDQGKIVRLGGSRSTKYRFK